MAKTNSFNLFMISAMYENGGNTLQRHLDGHSRLFSYPFESQVGTKNICDYLGSLVPHKYRWPAFQIGETAHQMYEDFYDEEVKIRIKMSHVSKFKNVDIKLDDKERKKIFVKLMGKNITRATSIEAFFRATNQAWKNYNKSGKENIYVGYNPVQILDAEKIISDFPNSKIIHIVRNPYSAYAETKHRPVPLSLQRYINTWNVVQLFALNCAKLFPDNVIIVRFEDLISDKQKFFSSLCKKLNIRFEEILTYPSWNGKKLENIYPWGTIQYPTEKYNAEKMKELSKEEYEKIKNITSIFNEHFDYNKF